MNNLQLLMKEKLYIIFLSWLKNIRVVEATTDGGYKRNSFIYDFMSSMRQKINDPLGQRAKKRKEISQR